MNIEPLEARIAPAVVIAANGRSATYTDIDGDRVTVATSKGAFVFTHGPDGDFGDSFVFTTANAVGGQQLVYVDLTLPGFAGADLTFTVAKAGAGDGLAAVGYINAQGADLGAITVKGDLNEIDAGDADTTTPAIELLSVRSLGRYGDATDSLVPGLTSIFQGALGALRVSEDIKDARLIVTAANDADAKIGSITIGGSLIGGAAADTARIFAEGNIGPVKIGRDVVGGAGLTSGTISSLGGIASVAIGGSLIGGAGQQSANISAAGALGPVSLGGNLIGGTGVDSAQIFSDTKLGAVTIGGSLLGGAGAASGSLFSSGAIGPVKIAHDVKGGAGDESGKIDADGTLGAVTIGGSLLGGDGDYSTINAGGFVHRGQIYAIGGIGAVTIGHDVVGSSGVASGGVRTEGNLASLTVGGSILGGMENDTARFVVAGDIGLVKIGHDVQGGAGQNSGAIDASGSLAGVTIGGSLLGGGAIATGRIFSSGSMGAVKIGHDVIGGAGLNSGSIRSFDALTSISVGGSLVGGGGNGSGSISISGAVGAVSIGHDVVGGSIAGTAPGLDVSGAIFGGKRIASVTIGGSIIAGTDASTAGVLTRTATIRAGDDIGTVTVRGSLVGNTGPEGDAFVVISARGQAGLSTTARTDVAIGKISIGGRAEFAQIFAGYGTNLSGTNADAQIGAVSVGADWIASSIVAGAFNTGADLGPGDDNLDFGNPFDAKIAGGTDVANRFSKIGSIAITGQVFGVPGSSPDFGFVSEEIGVLKIGGVTLALQTGRNNDGRVLSPTGDLRLHEIDAAFLAAALATTSAKLVNATTVTYDDIDGDHVTVRLSKPLLTAGNVNTVFTFNTGAVNDGVLARQQLQLIDLTDLAAAGVSVTVTVVRGGGDRLANVGAILADEDLGTITLPGDLGQIEAGDATVATRGLAALNVRTLGRLGLDTQPAGSATFTPFLGGDILGALGALTVKQDLAGASLAIGGALGPVTIGGSLIGGSAAASGAISTVQGIGAVKIGQHVQVGTAGNSGFIDAGTSIASLTVGGSIIGGSVNADGTTLGTVTVAHNVLGSLSANTGVGNVTIAGSVLGGTGLSSGRIFAAAGGIGAVSIGHNLRGGSGDESGKIDSAGQLASVTIRGSLLGGSGDYDTTTPAHSGQIVAVGAMGAITIGHNVQGGDGEHSAGIESGGTLTRLTVGGSLAGGAGFFSGNALAEVLAAVKIGRNLLGGSGGGAGYLEGFTSLGAVEVGGSLVGGTGTFDGAIYTGGSLGAVKIGHDVHGGTAGDAGGIKAETSIASVSIGGSLLGGSALRTGAIRGGDIGPVKIGRDLLGGSIAGMTGNLDATGYLESTGRLASVNIGGSIIAGSDDSTGGALTKNASIRAGKDLGALVVKGSLIGNVTANGATPVILSARGEAAPTATRDLAIGKINIGGSVERTLILAGYTTAVVASDTLAAHANNKAQIGAVNVGRDWSASSLVAGILNLGNGFGDGNDVLGLLGGSSDTIARIASVVIGGTVIGSAAPGLDHFGFSSVRIGSFKSLNFTAPLTASTTPDVIELSPITGDVTIREV